MNQEVIAQPPFYRVEALTQKVMVFVAAVLWQHYHNMVHFSDAEKWSGWLVQAAVI